MTSSQRKSTECHGRRGSMSVEFALVMPPLFVLLWGIIEFGRMVMVADTLISAAQEGCRAGIVPGSSTANVTAQANATLSLNLVPNATVTVSPAEVATLKTGEALTVTVQVPFSQVSWLKTPQYLGGKTLKATCTMVREAK